MFIRSTDYHGSSWKMSKEVFVEAGVRISGGRKLTSLLGRGVFRIFDGTGATDGREAMGAYEGEIYAEAM